MRARWTNPRIQPEGQSWHSICMQEPPMSTRTVEEQKEANRIRAREWARQNRERAYARNRTWRQSEAGKAYQKTYYEANKNKLRDIRRQWQKDHPEKTKVYERRYRERNLNLVRERARNYRRKAAKIPEATRPAPVNCECCSRQLEPGRKTHLDHNHKTGGFRGWLCDRCNRGLGYFDDCIEGLQKAVAYLTRNPG